MLTDKQCRNAKPKERAYKLADGQGLHLYVSTTGHRSWRLKYRFAKKERRLVFGAYPEVGLAEAREATKAARALLREGRDPGIEAKRRSLMNAERSADTFELMAREWHRREAKRWKPVHAKDVITSLERDIFPFLGSIPIREIDTIMVLNVLRKVEARGAIETAHRLRQRISSICVYAIAGNRALSDPAASLGQVLEHKPRPRRWPAAKTIEDARWVLAKTDAAEATPIVKLASRFLAITAQRPGMIRSIEWSDIKGVDWSDDGPAKAASWEVPAAKLKLEFGRSDDDEFDHSVPLSAPAVEVLQTVRQLTGIGQYVFCSARSVQERMSENALSYMYLRVGLKGEHVPHGWRSTFSTVMNELTQKGGKDDRQIIDLMLAHIPEGISASELRYNRAQFMWRRREIANQWAALLLKNAPPATSLLEGRRRRKS